MSNRERGDSYSYGERLFWPSKGSVATIFLTEKGNKNRWGNISRNCAIVGRMRIRSHRKMLSVLNVCSHERKKRKHVKLFNRKQDNSFGRIPFSFLLCMYWWESSRKGRAGNWPCFHWAKGRGDFSNPGLVPQRPWDIL